MIRVFMNYPNGPDGRRIVFMLTPSDREDGVEYGAIKGFPDVALEDSIFRALGYKRVGSENSDLFRGHLISMYKIEDPDRFKTGNKYVELTLTVHEGRATITGVKNFTPTLNQPGDGVISIQTLDPKTMRPIDQEPEVKPDYTQNVRPNMPMQRARTPRPQRG